MSTDTKKNTPREASTGIAILKFVPLVIFILLVIFAGLDLLVAAPIATLCAAVVSMYVNRCNFDTAFEFGVNSTRSIVMVFFVSMFAYGVGECFMATGVGAAIINIALAAGVTGRTIACVSFILTAALSLATGTSWGTFAACAPIFLWLNYILGGNLVLVLGLVVDGRPGQADHHELADLFFWRHLVDQSGRLVFLYGPARRRRRRYCR